MTYATSSTARQAMRASLPTAALGLVLLAAPAHADAAEGWGTNQGWEHTEDINTLLALLLLGGVPILLFLLIVLAVYVPAMVRGEGVSATSGGAEDHWLGGPRQGPKELTTGDSQLSQTGGARGSW